MTGSGFEKRGVGHKFKKLNSRQKGWARVALPPLDPNWPFSFMTLSTPTLHNKISFITFSLFTGDTSFKIWEFSEKVTWVFCENGNDKDYT